MTPSFVSWFSGVGMFDLALIRAGFERRGACEIDKFARKVYAARLGAPAFFSEDITSAEAKDIPDADLWVGGFPCQDVSVAGKRAGIGDGETRSGLVHTFLRLAVAKRPRFLLLENVPGLLSGASNDGRGAGDVERDEMGEPAGDALWFGSLLGALAESGYRHGAWRILDARWFGVAQRRRRVFLLFARDPRDGAVARAVLSEPESVRRGPPTRGEARAGAAAGARGGLAGLGEQRVARALGGVGGGQDPAVGKGDLIVAATLTTGGRETGPHGALDGVNLVAHSLQAADGHHGRRSPRGDGGDNLVVARAEESRVAATLLRNSARTGFGPLDENLVPVAFDRAQITHPANRSRCEPGAHDNNVTLRDGKRYVAPCGRSCGCWPDEVEGGDIHHDDDCWTRDRPSEKSTAVSFHATQDPISSRDVSPCLGTGSKQGTATTAVNAGPAVRRLTPMECELLQGLPRGWTCLCGVAPYSTAACKCPDGSRYRAVGNGGAVPVVFWIGRRLKDAMERDGRAAAAGEVRDNPER